jgi:hypothetical protein
MLFLKIIPALLWTAARYRVRTVFIGISLLASALMAQSVEIADFYSSTNKCDYLIVTPQIYSKGAERLANLRNTSDHDDVKYARIMILEKLIVTGSAPDTTIRQAVQWATKHWLVPPAYVVLIGDDSVSLSMSDTTFTQFGPMPTHVSNIQIRPGRDTLMDMVANYSDDWYTLAIESGSAGPAYLPIAIGRIPCESTSDLEIYLNKLECYDTLESAEWRKKILMIADDDFQINIRDGVDHEKSAEAVLGLLSSRQTQRLFLNYYTREADSFHTEAKNAFFSEINRGYGWTIYFGHGHPTRLSDENFLEAADYTRFNNPSAPTILFSMSCLNGGFYKRADSSMCKRFLFTEHGGTIAHIANPNLTYGILNEMLMSEICTLRRADSSLSIGKVLLAAKLKTESYSTGLNHEVFGDPAIQDPAAYTNVQAVALGVSVTDASVMVTVNNTSFTTGQCSWKALRSFTLTGKDNFDHPHDTVLASGELHVGNSFRIRIPEQFNGDSLTFQITVWNEWAEGFTQINLSGHSSSGFPQTMISRYVPEFSNGSYREISPGPAGTIVTLQPYDILNIWEPSADSIRYRGPYLEMPRGSGTGIRDVWSSPTGHIFFAASPYMDPTNVTLHSVDSLGRTQWSTSTPSKYSFVNVRGSADGGCLVWGPDSLRGTPWIARFDSAGKPTWMKYLTDTCRIVDMVGLVDGACICLGERKVKGVNDNVIEPLLIYCNSQGDHITITAIKAGGMRSVSSMCAAGPDRWIIAGTIQNADSARGEDMWVAAISSAGDTLWSRAWGDSRYDAATSIFPLSNGTFALGGSSMGRAVIVVLDATGEGLYTIFLPLKPGVLINTCRVISEISGPSQMVVAQGVFDDSFLYETMGIVSASGAFVDSREYPVKRRAIKTFKAYAGCGQRVYFEFGSASHNPFSIDVFDLKGRRIHTLAIAAGTNRCVWDTRIQGKGLMARGAYIARIHETDGSVKAQNVLIHVW